MKTNHSPGPWTVHGGNIIQDTAQRDIAKCWLADGPVQLPTVANARLMAMAPTLLMVLENLVNDVSVNFPQVDPFMLRYARAAIANSQPK